MQLFNMSSILNTYVQFANFYNILLLILCLLGLVLNIIMLVIFFTRRKVRHSAYTIYMVQIAVTDTAICLLWFVMAAMRLSEMHSTEFNEEEDLENSQIEWFEATSINETRNSFFIQRLVYAMYYFHYYNNIFLLAAMSVERSVAVMKSLRCQRYNFKKKFIYCVSALMWFLAFICALPSFINPALITENEQAKQFSPEGNSNTSTFLPSLAKTLFDCRKPLLRAKEQNSTHVEDCCGVKARECNDFFIEFGNINSDSINEIFSESGNSTYEENYPVNDSYPFNDYGTTDELDSANDAILTEEYELLCWVSFEVFKIEIDTDDLDDICDPHLSEEAKLYQIIVNLILGFFIPYLAIAISNLFIAFVLRVRANVRMYKDPVDEDKLTRRRMSEFFRQFSHGLSRSDGDSYARGSPVTRRDLRSGKSEKFGKPQSPKANAGYALLESELKKPFVPSPGPKRPSLSNRPQHTAFVKARDAKLQLSTQLRRTSGGSGSSAESFLTDVTSLQTSPSPNVRLSAPSFAQSQDGKGLVQRASSADSSGGSSSSRPVSTRRWSGEVFRANGTLDDGRRSLAEKRRKDEVSQSHRESDKFHSTLPSRGERCESTQELLGSHNRLSPARFSRHNHTPSDDLSRARVGSAASRTSTGAAGNTGSLRLNITQKHAVKQMRVSGIVLCFVIVFTVSWLPQRIVTMFYVTESMVGRDGYFCNVLHSVVRLISFLSVLLNPIVYAVTQREIRQLLRKFFSRLCVCVRKKTPPTQSSGGRKNANGASENKNISGGIMNHLTTDELSRQERHARNRERWSRLVRRLGRPNVTASGFSTHEKPSDGTIDEEREDEKSPSSKNPSSKGQSSSNSYKIASVLNGMGDLKQFSDLQNGHSNHSNGNTETIL